MATNPLPSAIGLPQQSFLRNAGDKITLPVIDHSAVEAARATSPRAFHRIKVPVIKGAGTVKPKGVIQAGNHQFVT